MGLLQKQREPGELGKRRVVHGPSVGRKEALELLGIRDLLKASLRIEQEEASSEASTARLSLQVPSLVARPAQTDETRAEHTQLPLQEGVVHLQLRPADPYTNARSTLLSRSSTSIDPLPQRTQETRAGSIIHWAARATATQAKSLSSPLVLPALDCDQAGAGLELALRAPALPWLRT